jgi:hypothetical protein
MKLYYIDWFLGSPKRRRVASVMRSESFRALAYRFVTVGRREGREANPLGLVL